MSPAKKKAVAPKSGEAPAGAAKPKQAELAEVAYSQEFLESEQAMIEAEKAMAELVGGEGPDQ